MFAKNADPKFKTRALIVVLIGFITMYCTGCFGSDIINVIQEPLAERLGISATQAVLGWTIGGYSVIAIAFIWSTIIMKKGVRQFGTICFFVMAVGAILVSFGYTAKNSALIIVGGFLLKNFLMALQLCVFEVVARWFAMTRGTMLGIMGASFALDNATSSTALSFLYNGLGFSGMMIVAAVILAVMGVLTFLFVRTAPSEIGLSVDGLPEESHQNAGHEEHKSKWTLGKLLRVKESWCIMLGCGIWNMTLSAVITQFFGSVMGAGYDMGFAMMLMVVFGLLGIVMSPIYGKIVDKLGAPASGIVCAALYLVSIIGFAFSSSGSIVFIILAALGLTFFVGAPVLQPALTMHVFGPQEYQATNRYLNIVVNLIAACGLPFMTIFYDTTGSYQMAYYTLLVLNVIVLVLMLSCRRTYTD